MRVKQRKKTDLKLNIQKTKIIASSPITSWQTAGEKVKDFIFLGSKINCRWWLQPWNWKTLAPWKKSCDQPGQHVKKQRHHFADKCSSSQSYGFSSSHVWMWELDHEEGWAPKNWCFQNVVLEKTFESPLDSKEMKPVNPKGNQPWIFIGRADIETPILYPTYGKSQLIGKDSDAWKNWGQQEKGATDNEMVGWHHRLNGYEFEQTLGDSEGQGSLACFSSCGRKESNTS